nr:PREDICTED: transforming acidic coiled-coil-containing protein 3-like [Latimeria chalumnae]|eukprot:XP_014351559.1 PREDICTED: transforming acidic coiled-coil-containing protein 3-like [Latimeria chalumnae]
MLEDLQKQKKVAKIEIRKVLEEKQEVIADLNSMEKSCFFFKKQIEKNEEKIVRYRKNEEALKKCAQEGLAQIKKEKERYQTLKADAEKKLYQANVEIAQVQPQFRAESVTLQARLHKEQMKVQSLERSLEQEAKENEKLTKIHDDLRSMMEKI